MSPALSPHLLKCDRHASRSRFRKFGSYDLKWLKPHDETSNLPGFCLCGDPLCPPASCGDMLHTSPIARKGITRNERPGSLNNTFQNVI
mmetsp:Transcript_28399/g.71271  ORF Transcript_28399/g.71271 Transcript_28399/m.71271 type:complete len:89 (-) Transcript_28399:4-270(-)